MIDTGIPANNIINFVNVCVETQQPNNNPDCCPTWFAAPMLSTGTATPDEPNVVVNYESAVALFGAGSIAADMARFYFLNNPDGQLYITGLEDTGVPAFAQLGFPGTATQSGTVSITVADVTYSLPVLIGDQGTDIANNFIALVYADDDALVTASITGGTQGNVTLTAKNGGTQSNDLTILLNALPGQTTPEGISVNINVNGFNGGGGAYDLATALDNLDCCCYDFLAIPFTGAVEWNQIDTEVLIRWDCSKLIGGHWFAPKCGTFTELFSENFAYTHGSIITCCPDSLYAPWQKVAAWVGQAHDSTCNNPAARWNRDLIGIRCTVQDCDVQCFDDNERNLLALNKYSVSRCGPAGVEQIELTVSAADFAIDQVGFFPQNYYSTIRFVRNLKEFIEDRFSNSQIVNTLEDVQDGSDVVTIPIIVAEIVAWARLTQSDIIDNTTSLNEFINIDVNPDNPYRVDMCITIDLVNALRTFAVKIQPRLNINANI